MGTGGRVEAEFIYFFISALGRNLVLLISRVHKSGRQELHNNLKFITDKFLPKDHCIARDEEIRARTELL